MTTASEIIKKAMQKAGVLTKAETPASDEASDGLDSLNDLMASLSNDSIFAYQRVTESFSLVSGTASYTIGSAGTFTTARPIKIIEAHTRQANTDFPITLISDTIYQGISDKTTQAIPYWLNYTNEFPTGTINLYPTPTAGYTLYITSEKALEEFTLSETVSLPPGWKRMLIYNLALELAPEYGQQPNPATVKIAKDSRGAIARSVLKVRSMDALPYGTVGPFNVYRGY